MTSPALRLAVYVVRGWTRVYTFRLPPEIGAARRAEILADLWELEHDPDDDRGLSPAAQILGRLCLGVPDDLWWRVEREVERQDLLLRRMAAATVMAAVVVMAFWVIPAWFLPADRTAPTPVGDCANRSAPPQTTSDLRMQVINCAGAFFTSRPPTDGRIDRRRQ